jgi:UDP-glucose 4-epimerase
MKIAITGALGHIGSYITREFLIQFPNIEIILIDNMMTKRYTSLFNLPKFGKIKFIESDLRTLDLDMNISDVNYIIHLAAITDAANSFENEYEVENNNYKSTERIAQFCIDKNIRLISLSSTSVYGTQNEIVDEDCSEQNLNPQSPYAKTKLKEERFLQDLNKRGSLKVSILRFGTIFGVSPGMRFHTAVNKFCWQAAMNNPITIWKTALNQKRPYLDLLDAFNAFKHIINFDLFDGEIYNVLTSNYTVNDIVTIIKMYKKDLNIEFVDNKIMNQLSYIVSNEKFCKTGFKFKGNLNKAIGDTLNMLIHN